MINCIFPTLDTYTGQSKDKDGSASGNYLVTRLNHHIQPNASFSSLNLVRDSYGDYKINPSNNQSTESTESTQKKAYEINREKQRKYRFK